VDTRAVLDHHLAAFGSGDTDQILEDYTDESVLITPGGVIRGRAALGGAFSGFFSELFAPGTYEFAVDAVHVEGDVAYIVWHADCASADVPLGTDPSSCATARSRFRRSPPRSTRSSGSPAWPADRRAGRAGRRVS